MTQLGLETRRHIFVAGGAGYIGSHTCVELLQAGCDLTVFDNFSNSQPEALRRVQQITSRNFNVVEGDIRDEARLLAALKASGCHSVIHFAGLKAVGESVSSPLDYYDNNVQGTLCLLRAMKEAGVRTLVFSSSATVYGEPKFLPITEDHPLATTSPYGRTKLFIEEILRDLYRAEPDWRISILRYFNPVAAHTSGLIGEDPRDVPNNLMPFIAQVAVGRREALKIWGNDYPTKDGTGVRDYIHVVDLAAAHLKALENLKSPQCVALNIGTGRGCSVLDLVEAFEAANGRRVPHEFAPRREGDVAACFASPKLAEEVLGWQARRNLAEMCRDTWRWQSANPQGYAEG